ncbi:glycosyl transferase [Pseudonocardia sichuanensis]
MTDLARAVRPGRGSVTGSDVLVVAGYLIASVLLYAGLWRDLDRGYLVASDQDQNLFEWLFAAQAHALQHGGPLLFSDLQNAPLGVNLMANTALPALAVPLAPVTLALGPTATWTLVLTGGLAGTATAWYWLFSRHVVTSRAAAALGAGFCGFAPPVISHAKAHPNFVVAFLLPVIVIWLVRLPSAARPVLHGVGLGLLVTLQVLIGEEILLIAVTATAPFVIGLAVARRRVPRTVVVGLATGGVVACALLAYPLWWQFFGRQSYRNIDHGPRGNPLAAFGARPSQSVGGLFSETSPHLAMNPTEENAYLGWGLVVLVAVLAVWLHHDLVARMAATTAGVAAVLSLGAEVTVDGRPTGVPGPWALLSELPLFESVLESRMALAAVPAVGCLLALATQRVLDLRSDRRLVTVSARAAWSVALVAVLLPLAPIPFETVSRAPTPAFFTSGEWRRFADPGRTIVPAPLPRPGRAEALRWQVDAGMGFALAQGYFVGPWGEDRVGGYGAAPRPSSALLDAVATTGAAPAVTDADRAAMADDLRFWRADAVVLADGPRQRELHATLSELLGPGRRATDAWVWDVRGTTRPAP